LAPQSWIVFPSKHWPLEQQPVGHDVTLQAQTPFEQICPAEQAGPVPQVQRPALEQPLAVAPQVPHDSPPVPHVDVDGVWQMAPAQQPFGQEAALQTHCPWTQACPVPHAGPDPQVHAPLVQPFAVVVSHAAHAAPSLPHTASVVAGVVQVVPAQQPPGHDAASQTQAPPEHSWPAAQAGPLPHEQSPAAEQLSAVPAEQATQPSPPKPHADSDRALQVGPEQQPAGHVAAHPLHVPRVQVSPPGQA
jgi:hypothetical protein